MDMISRRDFLAAATAAASLAAPLAAIEPFRRTGPPRMKLGLAAYSMRKYLTADSSSEGAIDMTGFVDYAATLDTLDAVELTSYYFPEEITGDYLRRLKRHCHVNGLDISGGAIRNNFTLPPGDELNRWFHHVELWAEHYKALGAPVNRIFAGNPPRGVSVEEAIERCIPNIEKACEISGRRGVMLALENHDFMMDVDRMMPVVEAVGSPWFGVNLDSGNFRSDDPYRDLEKIAPYAINAQIKTEITLDGEKRPTDLERIIKTLRDADYRGYVILEYEAGEDPYDAIPRHLDELRELIDA